MKHYDLTHISGKPDWTQIPSAAIDTYLWSDVRSIVPSFQAAWDEDGLYVRLQAVEPHIRRCYTGDLDMVCEDSCLEFFFSPDADSNRYFNFEVNPNGSLYLAFGNPGADRYRLYDEAFRELFQITPFEIPGGWGIELRVPVNFVKLYAPDFKLYSGLSLRANFFKCGDKTEQEHYMSWNPVEVSTPNFHLPEFFGTITLK